MTALATVESKAGEAGITGAAERFGVPLVSYPAARLAAIAVPHPSEAARAATGTPSVAEAAALAGGGELLVPKRRSVSATCAVATAHAHDLRHHGDAEVIDAGSALVDLAVNVRADTPRTGSSSGSPPPSGISPHIPTGGAPARRWRPGTGCRSSGCC